MTNLPTTPPTPQNPLLETLADKISAIMAVIPEAQRPAAGALLAEFGPQLLAMATTEAMGYLRRLVAGDVMAAADLLASLSGDELLVRVKANTARWESVAGYNAAQADLRTSIAVKAAPVLATILFAIIGL